MFSNYDYLFFSAYRAPELGTSLDWTFATDLFSLGILLYQLFTGTKPSLREPLSWKANNSNGKSVNLSPSAEFKDLVCGLTTADPSKRYTWNDLLSHVLLDNRLAPLLGEAQTLLDSETVSGDGQNSDRDVDDYAEEQSNSGDETPRATNIVVEQDNTQGHEDAVGTLKQELVDLNINRPPTACGRGGLLGTSMATARSGLASSRPGTAGRLTPCQALDSGPVETRTARTPQHAVLTPNVGTPAIGGIGYGDDTSNMQIFHESDLIVTGIVDNQRIYKFNIAGKFDTKQLPVQPLTAEKFNTMSDRDRTRYVTSLIDLISGVNEKGPMSAKRVNTINYSASFFSSSAPACDNFAQINGFSTILKVLRETNQTVDK